MKWFRKWREERAAKVKAEEESYYARQRERWVQHERREQLARRERIATAALAGVLANPDHIATLAARIEIAVRAADALIAQLEGKTK